MKQHNESVDPWTGNVPLGQFKGTLTRKEREEKIDNTFKGYYLPFRPNRNHVCLENEWC